MNFYEHTIIARQDTSPSEIKQLTEKYSKIVEKNDGEVVKTENWGLLNLSYLIKKNKKGSYIHFKIKGKGNVIDELEKNESIDKKLLRYITIKVSELLEDPDKYLKPKMYVRVTLDIKISYEEANFVRETFIDKYQLRELQLIPEQVDNAQQPMVEVQKFDSVDQIVIKQLQGVDSETYDKNILTAIYNDLDVNN